MRLIVAEDDLLIQKYLSETLSNWGVECIPVVSIQQLRFELSQQKISTVLTNTRLQDGILYQPELNELKAKAHSLIIMSASLPIIDAQNYKQLEKPFSKRALHKVVFD